MPEDYLARETIDPVAVSTVADLAGCLQALRRRRGYSYAALDEAARALPPRNGSAQTLPRSTVSDVVNGKSLPSREMLLTFLAACHVARVDVPQWLAALERARAAEDSGPVSMIRVSAVNARTLGVHAAVALEEGINDLPVYVPRDIDAELQAAMREGSGRGLFVLLVGRPSAGKTRCAYEALLAALPAWWLLHPADAQEVRDFATSVTPRTVVWLDEIKDYIADGLQAATVVSLLRTAEPVIVIGTIWPDRYQEFTAAPQVGEDDKYWNERRLLRLAHVFDVGSQLSAAEYGRALEVGRTDPRIAVALRSSDYPMTAVLAAAPELVRRWENAPDPYGEMLITAAIDSMRLGVRAPLSPEVLRAAISGYLNPAQQANAPAGWFGVALAYATETLRGAAAAMAPVGAGMGVVAGYAVADYLLEYGSRVRRTAVPPDSFWNAYTMLGADARDLRRLGEEAAHRVLLSHAESLYRSAITAGEVMGWVRLAELRGWQGRQEEAVALWRRAAEAGYGDAWDRLVSPLAQQQRTEEAIKVCREALAAGFIKLRCHLASLLERQGCMTEAEELLKEEVAAGNLSARISLAELLESLGRAKEAEQMWRREIAAGVQNSRTGLAGFLRGQGRVDEAIAYLHEGIEAGDDPYAWKWLADTYEQQGLTDEAIEARKKAIAMGEDLNAWSNLFRLLEGSNRANEAVSFAYAALEAGDFEASEFLAYLLESQGRIDEAVAVLADVTAAGYPYTRSQFADLLCKQGKAEEAEQVLRDGVAAGETFACSALANFLYRNGQLEAAIETWWYALDNSGHPNTAYHLAETLVKCGRVDEAEQVWRHELAAGNAAARGWLAHLLEEQGRTDEADDLRSNGLTVDAYRGA